MPQQDTINVPAKAWTQISDADVTSITFQVLGNAPVFVAGTVGASAPANTDGAIRYMSGQGERNALLTDLFPGVSGANRVYAYSEKPCQVVISHA